MRWSKPTNPQKISVCRQDESTC
ncbi:unnamed protein product [Acanthoscelides obtectus]|uniref:Uncharacterized protein n=1 Tax=Acanthoscelides obtectus TaxID=200917 RepID=A0A9P0LD06_ACAOB|nr:unnamed protein product [Acanthoscelides obtectus]CAK1672481.1 hypothetical protein AOBTE_LOCUS28926 [Acanthoscelides obtectus]